MRKWPKRILLTVALLMALFALFVTGGLVLLRGTPDYYRKTILTTEQRAQAAARAESTLSQMQNLAADTHGAETQKLSGATRPAPIPGARTFTFSDDEINALFNKWAELHNWKDLLSRVVEDPMIVLQDHRVIFAGQVKVKNVDTVVSIHFVPVITPDGKFDLKLDQVLGGKLPLPRDTVISPMRDKIVKTITSKLPAWQSQADIAPNGATNADAMKSALGKLVLLSLSDTPAEPVLFLPLLSSKSSMTVPVRLTDVTVTDKKLSITVVPMDAPQRATLLERIKQPVQITDAAGN